jgi:hypothetical protein
MLLSYAELLNNLAVSVKIVRLQVIQMPAPLADHFQEPSP